MRPRIEWTKERLAEIESWIRDNGSTVALAAEHFDLQPSSIYGMRIKFGKSMHKVSKAPNVPKIVDLPFNQAQVSSDQVIVVVGPIERLSDILKEVRK